VALARRALPARLRAVCAVHGLCTVREACALRGVIPYRDLLTVAGSAVFRSPASPSTARVR